MENTDFVAQALKHEEAYMDGQLKQMAVKDADNKRKFENLPANVKKLVGENVDLG